MYLWFRSPLIPRACPGHASGDDLWPQQLKFREFHSNERPGMTSVFGTSVPPSGLSGLVRRLAFGYSESSFGHWIPLLLADRINVIEGIFDDLIHGHIPNVFAEMGLRAERKHNPVGFRKKMFLAGFMALVPLALFFVSKQNTRRKYETSRRTHQRRNLRRAKL